MLAAFGCFVLAGCQATPPEPEPAESAALALYMKARIARVNGDAERCIVLLEQANALAPDDAPIAAALGEARLASGQEHAARAVLERAVALDGDDVASRVLLARLDLRQRQPEVALSRLLVADELRPARPEVLELLHPLLLYSGETERGIAVFTRALALAPGLALAHEAYGDFLSCAGREGEALASYRRALALDPTRRGAELKAARLLEQHADDLLRRIALPPSSSAPGPGVGLPAAPRAAAGSG